jgi:O-antigen/teichoic acid export membrane protein
MKNDNIIVQGRHLASNSVLNLATNLLILLLNLLFVPIMLRTFGTELYGILSVTWIVLANMGWLDFGFSRATARFVAQELIHGRPDQAAKWTWTAILSQVFLGVLGAAVICALSPYLVELFKVDPAKRELALLTFRLFAFSIPVDFAVRSVSGVLQATQRFDWVNGLSVLNTIGTFSAFAVGIWGGGDFEYVIYGLFAVRLLNLITAFYAARRVLPSLGVFPQYDTFAGEYKARVVTMLKFGSWVAAASMIGPLLLYCDQWLVSGILGVAFLPYYAIPFNLLTKLGIFPSSISLTLFPAFSAMQEKTEWSRMERYYVRAHRFLLAALIPILFILFVWSHEILRIWVDPLFAANASLPLQILTIGFGIALLGPLSGALIEAVGRPDLLVKLYAVELPINALLVWYLTKEYGIAGAATSYTIRAFAETIIIWIMLYRAVHFSWLQLLKSALYKPAVALVIIGLITPFMAGASLNNPMSIIGTLLILSSYCIYAGFVIFDSDDKSLVMNVLKYRRHVK